MSRLDDILGGKKKQAIEERPPSEELIGNFDCNHTGCYDWSPRAEYFPNIKTLIWKCGQGHECYIEKFEIE